MIDRNAARRLVAAVYGEREVPRYAPWSRIEQQTLHALIQDIAASCRAFEGCAWALQVTTDHRRLQQAQSLVYLTLDGADRCRDRSDVCLRTTACIR